MIMQNLYWVERYDIEDPANPEKFQDEFGWVYPSYSWMTAEEFFMFALANNDYYSQFHEHVDQYIYEHADKLFYEELCLIPLKSVTEMSLIL